MGLMVDDIVDIVEEPLEIEVASRAEGVLGSAVIKDQATDVLDVGHFLPLADPDWFHRRRAVTGTSRPHVLLVDDSAFFRNMLTPVLEAAGFAVTGAAVPGEALRLAQERRLDAIVLDIDLPEMTGFDLAAAIAADRRSADTPIVALASYVSAEVVERGRAAGFRDFVAKFDRAGLVTALRETMVRQEQAA
jgi:two-component system chemotaxis sensor kinase CheA